MRRMMIGIACLIAGIGAALAQEQATVPERPAIRYDMMPDGRDFERNYPPDAMREGVPGVAALCCTIQADRTLSCEVAREWPEGRGFGAASVVVARGFRVFEESYLQAQAADDLSVRRTLLWPLPETTEPQMRRLREVSARLRQGVACPVTPPPPIQAP
jgi:hypothetical protein